MKQKWERKEVLLLLILIALCADIALRMPITQSIADTFRLDDCITTRPDDKPDSYVHVVAYPSEK